MEGRRANHLEYSDSERSTSSISSESSGQFTEDEGQTAPINKRAHAPFTSPDVSVEQHRDLQSSRVACGDHPNSGSLNVDQELQRGQAGRGVAENLKIHTEAWIAKMQEQKGRVLPVSRERPPKLNADSIPYKLSILWTSGIVPPENTRSIFECRVGVSLFDETSNTFFGNTCPGVPRPWTAAVPGASGAVSSCQLEQDVFFHTRVVDPKCSLIVELIAVEKNVHGVILDEYSLGWSTISLSAEARPTPPAALLPAYGLAREGVEVQLAWIKSGTPRYLMLRDLPHLAPPEQLAGCVLAYDLARYEPFGPTVSLLRENELVTDRDLVPGILRIGPGGTPTRALRDAFSTVKEPVVMPSSKIVLSNLRLRLPSNFHQLLVTDGKRSAEMDPHESDGRERTSLYQLRLTVHNGRRFTSYTMCTNRLQSIPGSDDLELADDLQLSGVYEDADVALVLELSFTGPLAWQTTHECDDCGPNGTCRICAQLAEPLPLCWAPIFPFDTTWRVKDGPFSVQMRGGPAAWPRDHLTLDWSNTLIKQSPGPVPKLSAEFSLQTLSRVGPNLDFSSDSVARRSQDFSQLTKDTETRPARSRDLEKTGRESYDVPVKVESRANPPKSLSYAQEGARGSPYTSTTLYIPEPREPPRAKVTSPEVLAERAARAAAEVAAAKAAAAVTEGAGKRVREVEAMANAMKEQLRALTEAVTRIETAVTSANKPRKEVVHGPTQDRRRRSEAMSSRKERRIWAAVVIQKYVRRFLARAHLHALRQAEKSIQELKQIPPTNHGRRESNSSRFNGGFEEAQRVTEPTRALRAQLHKAGASEALPREMRAVLGRAPRARSGQVDLALELSDERSVNELVVQFLAFTPGGGSHPKSLYFTFQLYDFLPCTTRTVPLNSSANSPSEPIILSQDLLYKYRVEGAREPRMRFFEYLRSKSLSIDVWDGDSLFQLGTATVDLAGLLRQRKEASEVLTESQVEGIPLTSVEGGGELLVRLVNLGHFPKPDSRRRRSSNGSRNEERVKEQKVRVFPSTDLLTARPDASDAANDGLGGSSRGHASGSEQRAALESAKRRKEARRERLREMLEETKAGGVNNLRGFRSMPLEKERRHSEESVLEEIKQVDVMHKTAPVWGRDERLDLVERERMLRELEQMRTKRKQQVIQEKLRDCATKRRTVYPSYGELIFFEEELQNPYGQEAVFQVECSDPELQLIRDRTEWTHLRSVTQSNLSGRVPDEDLFDREGHLFLGPHESCRLAFKYQCNVMPADPDGQKKIQLDGRDGGARAHRIGEELPEGDQREGSTKVVKIKLVACKDGWPADVREVEVCIQPLILDRTFRYYQAEHDYLRQSLPAPCGRSAICVRSSDPKVLVGLTDGSSPDSDRLNGSTDGQNNIWIKAKSGPAPETALFYVTVYGDRWMGQMLATWRVFVHSLRRHDIGATLGQTTRSTLVVRGSHVTKHMACYCTDSSHLEIRPAECVLQAGSLTELSLAYKPSGTEDKRSIQLHLVDTQSRQLVGAYMVAVRTSSPVPSKMFEVEIAAGSVAKKKISFTNPYPHPKLFYLTTSCPDLIAFRPSDVLDLPPDATRYIGLSVNGAAVTRSRLEEALIFVNDAEDKTEECLKVCIKVH